MPYKLNIRIGSAENQILFYDSFFCFAAHSTTIHKHSYSEVHIVYNGCIDFFIGSQIHTVAGGNIFIIPPKVLHSTTVKDPYTQSINFILNKPIDRPMVRSVPVEILSSFFNEVSKAHKNNLFPVTIPSYLSMLCSLFYQDEQADLSEITDDAFIISEFFNRHYADTPALTDLAKELNLSERQTQRLVFKHTGKTFKQEISHRKIETARILLEKTNMVTSEIAKMLGYNSYSSLWKALKKDENS